MDAGFEYGGLKQQWVQLIKQFKSRAQTDPAFASELRADPKRVLLRENPEFIWFTPSDLGRFFYELRLEGVSNELFLRPYFLTPN